MNKRRTRSFVSVVLTCCFTLSLASCGGETHRLEAVEGFDADCEHPGVLAHFRCADCGELFADASASSHLDSPTVPALDHDFGDPVITRDLCSEWGISVRVCRRCGKEETEEIAPTQHCFGEYRTVPPTCLKDGERVRICENCSFEEREILPATGIHSFDTDNVCKLCGLRCVPTEGLEFTLIVENGLGIGYSVNGSNVSGHLVIPYYHESLPVLEIAGEAFLGAEIRNFISYAPLRAIGDRAFKECYDLSTIVLPETLKRIGEEAFSNCASLQKIRIPDSVEEVGARAFYVCSELSALELGAGVSQVDCYTFWNCEKLSEITVSAGNKTYYSAGNCLIGRATNVLVLGSTKSVIPDSVKIIGKGAFCGRIGLKKITIPLSVTEICDYAFLECKDLAEIVYGGSEQQWNAIPKGKEWDGYTAEGLKITFLR